MKDKTLAEWAKEAHEWAKHIAQDSNGSVWAYEQRPRSDGIYTDEYGGRWMPGSGKFQRLTNSSEDLMRAPGTCPDWRERILTLGAPACASGPAPIRPPKVGDLVAVCRREDMGFGLLYPSEEHRIVMGEVLEVVEVYGDSIAIKSLSGKGPALAWHLDWLLGTDLVTPVLRYLTPEEKDVVELVIAQPSICGVAGTVNGIVAGKTGTGLVMLKGAVEQAEPEQDEPHQDADATEVEALRAEVQELRHIEHKIRMLARCPAGVSTVAGVERLLRQVTSTEGDYESAKRCLRTVRDALGIHDGVSVTEAARRLKSDNESLREQLRQRTQERDAAQAKADNGVEMILKARATAWEKVAEVLDTLAPGWLTLRDDHGLDGGSYAVEAIRKIASERDHAHADLPRLRNCEENWGAVCKVLNLYVPDWYRHPRTSRENALRAIAGLGVQAARARLMQFDDIVRMASCAEAGEPCERAGLQAAAGEAEAFPPLFNRRAGDAK